MYAIRSYYGIPSNHIFLLNIGEVLNITKKHARRGKKVPSGSIFIRQSEMVVITSYSIHYTKLYDSFIPMINTWALQAWDIEGAWLLWGGLLCLFFAPLAYYLVRDTPESVSLLPDHRTALQMNSNKNTPAVIEESWTLKEAMHTRAFWLLLICAGIPAMVNTGLTFHLISIFGSKGVDTTVSAFILSLMALTSFPVSFISGFVNERFKTNHILGAVFVGQIIAMLLMIFTENAAGAIAFGIVRGIVAGFESITFNALWPNYFGRGHIASINSITMTATVIGSAFGPLPFGYAFDHFGGYGQIP